jgi:hypothetical protein
MTVATGWLFLLVGIGLMVLAIGSVPIARSELTKILYIFAAVIAGVVVVLSLIRLTD